MSEGAFYQFKWFPFSFNFQLGFYKFVNTFEGDILWIDICNDWHESRRLLRMYFQ